MNELLLSALLLFAAPQAPHSMTLGQRIKVALGFVVKGSFGGLDFNRIPLEGGVGGSLTQPYKNSPWVNRAIKLVSLPIAEVPLRFSTDERGGKQLLNDAELTRFWESPALGADKRPMAFADVVESFVGWLKLSGEVFWLLDDTIFASRETLPFPEAGLSFPRFMVANPASMTPKVAADNSIIAWEWTDSKMRRHLFDPQQVIHSRLWNPYDEHRGLSEYAAAALAAEGDYLAAVLKRNVMRANGDQGQIIGVKTPLDDIQRKQLEAQLREKRELAARGIFKTIYLGSDITVADPKINIVDSSFPLVRAEDRHAVAIAFGVPPSMFEVAASYSIGSASDRYRLIVDTSMPTGRKLSEAIESVVRLQRAGETLFAWFDWKQHQVMQQVLRELIDPATKLWDRGMSWETVSEWLALNLPEFEGRDQGYLSFAVTPIEMVGQESIEGDASEPMPEDPEEMSGCPAHSGNGDAHWKRPAAEIKAWRREMNRRRDTIKRFESAFNRELFKARKDTLAKLDALASPLTDGPHSVRSAAADIIFDLAKWRGGLLVSMRKESRQALDRAGRQLLEDAGFDDPWTYPPAKALKFVAERENLLSNASEDIWRSVRDVISEGLDSGEPIAATADKVRAAFNGISRARAKTIALTETAAAYGEARQQAMSDVDIPYKRWLTSGASNVRPAHREANGQVVQVHEAFEVDGEALMGPGDPAGSPGNVINCHCIAIAVMQESGEIEA